MYYKNKNVCTKSYHKSFCTLMFSSSKYFNLRFQNMLAKLLESLACAFSWMTKNTLSITVQQLFIELFHDTGQPVSAKESTQAELKWNQTEQHPARGFLHSTGRVNAQSCLLINFQYQPISLQFSWLSVEQPIKFRLSVEYASLGIFYTIEDNSTDNMPYCIGSIPEA